MGGGGVCRKFLSHISKLTKKIMTSEILGVGGWSGGGGGGKRNRILQRVSGSLTSKKAPRDP